VAAAEARVAERRVAELGVKLTRLQEVFKERIAAFREACYVLFGYRVEMTSEPGGGGAEGGAEPAVVFSLRPRHSDTARSTLTFRFKPPYKPRDMEMIPSDFSRRHQTEVDTFVGRFKSISAFTANLTMELFQQQTQC